MIGGFWTRRSAPPPASDPAAPVPSSAPVDDLLGTPAAAASPSAERVASLAALVSELMSERDDLKSQLRAANRRIDYQVVLLDAARSAGSRLVDGPIAVDPDTVLRADPFVCCAQRQLLAARVIGPAAASAPLLAPEAADA